MANSSKFVLPIIIEGFPFSSIADLDNDGKSEVILLEDELTYGEPSKVFIKYLNGTDKYPELDPKFLFINIGYCFRPTELQGAFGIHQIKKLDNFIQIRRDNAEYWYDRLSKFKKDITIHQERNNTKHAWFGYPIIVNKEADFSRKYLTDYLNAAGIETRPVMTGNIALQPVMKQFKHRIVGTLPNATFISKNAFFFGNHQNITHDDREYVANCIASFLGI